MSTDKKYVAIVDYGMGNLFSIMNICQHVGLEAVKTADKHVIENAAAVILPGVGAFGDAMHVLEGLDLTGVVKDAAVSGKPFLGICLGMQLLMSESEEFGLHKGLDIIKGRVVKFPMLNAKKEQVRVPHIGWNKIFMGNGVSVPGAILNNVNDQEFMYFVHSFFVVPQEEKDAVTYTDYCGIRYCSGIQKNNMAAFQFHPEKSGPAGMKIFNNFKQMIFKG